MLLGGGYYEDCSVKDITVSIDYRNLGDDSSDLIVAFDADFRYTYVNPQVERLVNTPREKLIGRNIFDVAPHTQGTIYAVNYERALRERELIEFEDYYPPLKRWNKVRCVPQPDGGLLVFARNTTSEHEAEYERETAQARLKDSISLLNAVINGTTDMVAAIDLNRRFLFANSAVAQFLGFSTPDEILGRSDFELLTDERDVEMLLKIKEIDDHVLETGKPGTFEFVAQSTPNGQGARTYISNKVPLRDSVTDEIVGLFNIVHDITDRCVRERRDRFLAELTEAMRMTTDPESMVVQVVSSLGEFLNASRCRYVEVNEDIGAAQTQAEWLRPDTAASPGVIRLSSIDDDTLAALRSGRQTGIHSDAAADLSEPQRESLRKLSVASQISVPLHNGGQWIGMFIIEDNMSREWDASVRELMATVAQRYWLALENARLWREARLQAERNLCLAEVSDVLSATLDYELTLTAVAKVAVPRFADWCTIELLHEHDFSVQHVAIQHVNPSKIALGWELRQKYPQKLDREAGLGNVLSTGKSTFVPLVTEEMLENGVPDEAYRKILLDLGFNSVMIVPLVARDRIFGALSLIATNESGRLFSEDDLRLAEEIGRRAGLAIENSRLFQRTQQEEYRQRRIADALQLSLMIKPGKSTFGNFEVDAHYEAAMEESSIGGDFGDVFQVDPDKVAMLVGDCTGKGLGAARFVGECQFTARAFLRANPDDPAYTLSKLNRMLRDDQIYDSRPIEALTCVVIAVVDTRSGETKVAVAGAEPPVVYRKETNSVHMVEASGQLLGIDCDATYTSTALTLYPGDFLVMTTDGITEARNHQTRAFFGLDGLVKAVADLSLAGEEVEGSALRLLEMAKTFADGPLMDDACILVGRKC